MDATLDAKKRDGRGKNEARRLRGSGRIPAVVYGARKDGQAPEGVPVAVDPKEVLRILHSESGANTLINLKLDGSAESRVMVRDYQLDPVTHQLLHADFYQLSMDKAIVVSVPIVIKGEPAGVKQQGGLLDFVTREIQVQCLPTDIPERIDVDVSELMLHQSVRVKDLATDPKWKAMTDGGNGRRGGSGRSSRHGGRAGGHQEGQDREGRGSSEEVMRLIVGLGNPGKEYRETRHNVGFMVADEIAKRHGLTLAMAPSPVPDAFIAKKFGADPFLIGKPLTFMNRSGDAVAALAHYYDIVPAGLLVVVDEVALPFGRLRARARGSAGGHNGLKSVIERLGTTEFPRLRLGVGRGDTRRDLADHVLSKFEADERSALEELITRAADAAEMFAAEGIEKVMNAYNPGATDPD